MSCRVTPSTSHRPARISSAVRRSRRTSSAGTASRAPAGRGDPKRGARPASASPGIHPAQDGPGTAAPPLQRTCLGRQARCRRTSEDRHTTSCGDMHCRRRTYHARRARCPTAAESRNDGTSSRMAGAHALDAGLTSEQAVVDRQVMRLLMAPRQLLLDPAPTRGTHASPPRLVVDQIDEQAGHLLDVVRGGVGTCLGRRGTRLAKVEGEDRESERHVLHGLVHGRHVVEGVLGVRRQADVRCRKDVPYGLVGRSPGELDEIPQLELVAQRDQLVEAVPDPIKVNEMSVRFSVLTTKSAILMAMSTPS